jgi:hypothetical protein
MAQQRREVDMLDEFALLDLMQDSRGCGCVAVVVAVVLAIVFIAAVL